MVSNREDANASGDLPIKKMVRKSLQIRSPPIWCHKVMARWGSRSRINRTRQFLPEFVAQFW